MKRIKDTLFILLLTILIVAIMASCSTSKQGCGEYSRWENHTKYRVNGRN